MYADNTEKPTEFGGDLVGDKVESEYHSVSTLSEDKIFTEESIEDEEFENATYD